MRNMRTKIEGRRGRAEVEFYYQSGKMEECDHVFLSGIINRN